MLYRILFICLLQNKLWTGFILGSVVVMESTTGVAKVCLLVCSRGASYKQLFNARLCQATQL